ncbi:MAG: hypothetical protein EOP94_01300 [Zymomonas sp.]|nr:MAG: hypothetical protein EOP94_01300 [Zymomonas sp.]
MLLPLLLTLAGPQDIAAANAADLRCMAIFAVSTSKAPADQQAGVVAGTMFFYGKISGRSPALDVEAKMFELFKADPEGVTLEKDRQRCASEIKRHGTLLMAIGERMIAASKAQ